jgi:hypothetical protein
MRLRRLHRQQGGYEDGTDADFLRDLRDDPTMRAVVRKQDEPLPRSPHCLGGRTPRRGTPSISSSAREPSGKRRARQMRFGSPLQ